MKTLCKILIIYRASYFVKFKGQDIQKNLKCKIPVFRKFTVQDTEPTGFCDPTIFLKGNSKKYLKHILNI